MSPSWTHCFRQRDRDDRAVTSIPRNLSSIRILDMLATASWPRGDHPYLFPRVSLMGENVMDPRRYIHRVLPVLRGRALVAGSLIVFSLLSCATGCHAQQGQPSQARGTAIPTLEALPHDPLPSGDLIGWCGLNGKILLMVGRGKEIYDRDVKASPLSFPPRSKLQCDDDGQKLALIDDDAGNISEVDIPGGIVTRTLATYDKELTQDISFSPDLKNVASRQPLTLIPSAVNLNVIPLSGPGRRAIGNVHWHRDSFKLFGVSAPEGKGNHGIVEILNIQRQRIGSGALPAGFLFSGGWFANSQSLYLYLTPARDEFGVGVILRCRIENWKCDQIASNVIEASAGGDGILGMVSPIGKYSSNGDSTTIPPQYVAEIRNGDGLVVARQTFKSSERYLVHLTVAPSGTKAILGWYTRSAPGCPPQDQETGMCKGGIMIDLSGRLK